MQRSPLSPKLFCFVVDLALRDSEVIATMIGTGNLFAYADDLASTLFNKSYALEVMSEFKGLERENLTIHIPKAKFLAGVTGIKEAAVEIGVEAVDSFKYLGVEIHLSKEDTIKAAIKKCDRFSKASVAQIKNLVCSREDIATIQICIVLLCHTLY